MFEEKKQNYFKAPEKMIRNVIKCYAVIDQEIGSCLGLNYIVALILRFIDDEETAFWILVKIMVDLNWRRFFIVSDIKERMIAQMPEFLENCVPRLSKHLRELDEAVTQSICHSMPTRYILSIFTCS